MDWYRRAILQTQNLCIILFCNLFASTLDLRQGGVLSPLLFNLFIDDINDVFDETCDPVLAQGKHLSHLLYADDLVLMSPSQNGSNSCLDKLEAYCHTWQLDANIKKSIVIIFNPSGRKLLGPHFYFQGELLEIVQSYCYLGVDLLCSRSFRVARGNLVNKFSRLKTRKEATFAEFIFALHAHIYFRVSLCAGKISDFFVVALFTATLLVLIFAGTNFREHPFLYFSRVLIFANLPQNWQIFFGKNNDFSQISILF